MLPLHFTNKTLSDARSRAKLPLGPIPCPPKSSDGIRLCEPSGVDRPPKGTSRAPFAAPIAPVLAKCQQIWSTRRRTRACRLVGVLGEPRKPEGLSGVQ
jgi:hypothetical protein